MIVSAAIKLGNKVYVGSTHSMIMSRFSRKLFTSTSNFDDRVEGFVDENNKFYNRNEATKEAYRCKQIPFNEGSLQSYHLYK